jgi:hypothetical protein
MSRLRSSGMVTCGDCELDEENAEGDAAYLLCMLCCLNIQVD